MRNPFRRKAIEPRVNYRESTPMFAVEAEGSLEDVMKVREILENFKHSHIMNPETEDLLPDTRFLHDGMRVLITNQQLRVKDSRFAEWFTVTQLGVPYNAHRNLVSFVAVYDNGRKEVLYASKANSWLVTKESLAAVQKQNPKAGLEPIQQDLDRRTKLTSD